MVNPQLPLGLALRDTARFESFLAGKNQELVTLLQAMASGDGEAMVFVAAAAGMGKSHLLHATCHRAGAAARQVAYLPMRDIRCLQPDVLDGFEDLSLVCLDDMDAIAGDATWEQAVFDLFNRLRETGSALLVSAADVPQACGFHLNDLVTRLGWGVTATLKALDDSQLVAALALRAGARGLELPDETARYLLKRYPRDLNSLFAVFDRLDQASMIEQRRLTVPFVKDVLAIS